MAPRGYVDAGAYWYRLFNPRPVYIVASGGCGGAAFMAASWVTPVGEEPPRILAALGRESHTLSVIRGRGCFTVNVLGVEHRDFIYTAGVVSGAEVDKASLLGARFSCDTVTGCPRLVEPRPLAVVEARVVRLVEDAAEDTVLVVGEVEAAYHEPGVFRRGWDLRRVRPAMHLYGRLFTTSDGVYAARRRGAGGGQV